MPQLWVSNGGTGVGYMIVQVWARCVPCAVCHACMCRVKCDAFYLKNKTKQAADPNSLGATLSVRTRVRAPASFPFILFSSVFFFFPICFLSVGVFCSKTLTYLCTWYIFGTARLATQLWPSLRRDRFEVYLVFHSSLDACAVCHACMCRV